MTFSGKGKTVLAIGAHPDDVEFGCGGTMAKLAADGATIIFVVATLGNRGSRANQITARNLVSSRRLEQEIAAKILEAHEVVFLGHEDGNLCCDIDIKQELVRLIRKYKPDIVFTHDPTWIHQQQGEFAMINHTDHRAAGEATLDAIYPLSRDLLSFPQHLKEGLKPHTVREVYLYHSPKPNFYVDITRFSDKKFESIFSHKSQMDDIKKVEERVKDRLVQYGKKIKAKYAEGFTKLVLR